MRAVANDLDFLAAGLHGRRSQMAEGQRLTELCRIRSIPELGAALYPGREFQTAVDLQRRLVQDLVDEVSKLLAYLTGPGAGLLDWMLARFQVEDLKVLVRGFVTRTGLEMLQGHLVTLPENLALDTQALATASALEEFISLLPTGVFRKSLEEAVESYGAQPKPFFLEGALDRGYFRELLARAERVSGEDKEVIQPMVFQEVDIFHLMLVGRGKFHYSLPPALLLALHVPGTRISRARFIAMLGAPDLRTAANRAVRQALDFLPAELKGASEAPAIVESALLEALAWTRFLALANRAFRRSHMGLGAVVAYVGIRRVEVANLLTLSEGIRTGMAGEVIRARLLPRGQREAAYA